MRVRLRVQRCRHGPMPTRRTRCSVHRRCTPASIRAWSFHRNNVAGDMSVSVAISATASPLRRRCEICRRTECGYDLGTVTSDRSLCFTSHIDGALSGTHIMRVTKRSPTSRDFDHDINRIQFAPNGRSPVHGSWLRVLSRHRVMFNSRSEWRDGDSEAFCGEN